jgi:hypothetical protein
VGISIFLFLFWIPFSFLLFFIPYHIIMKDDGKPIFFYLLSLLAIVFFFIWSIANFADANGFVMVAANFVAGRFAAAVFGLITAVMMIIIALLAVLNTFLFFTR